MRPDWVGIFRQTGCAAVCLKLHALRVQFEEKPKPKKLAGQRMSTGYTRIHQRYRSF